RSPGRGASRAGTSPLRPGALSLSPPPPLPQPAVLRPSPEGTPVASASPLLQGMARPRGTVVRAAAARWGRVQRAAQAVVTGEHEGRATGGAARKCRLIELRAGCERGQRG